MHLMVCYIPRIPLQATQTNIFLQYRRSSVGVFRAQQQSRACNIIHGYHVSRRASTLPSTMRRLSSRAVEQVPTLR